MNFNQHSDLAGKHAILGASQYHWLNYDEQKLLARYHTIRSATRGTDLHKFAQEAIRLGILLDPEHNALADYVKDAIIFNMSCEVSLYYSPNSFGSADAISFEDGFLRIHDLKTGITKASFKQLYIYAALFCLEYEESPYEIEMEFRIYQRDEIIVEPGDPDVIAKVMDRIVEADALIQDHYGR